mmetsp:Transcript_21563/g.50745  ORF Transcript_21563/g.50745 Transcript_21563/m.50745 type:complete len:310 (+) Transcript_21563:755-1684(+)
MEPRNVVRPGVQSDQPLGQFGPRLETGPLSPREQECGCLGDVQLVDHQLHALVQHVPHLGGQLSSRELSVVRGTRTLEHVLTHVTKLVFKSKIAVSTKDIDALHAEGIERGVTGSNLGVERRNVLHGSVPAGPSELNVHNSIADRQHRHAFGRDVQHDCEVPLDFWRRAHRLEVQADLHCGALAVEGRRERLDPVPVDTNQGAAPLEVVDCLTRLDLECFEHDSKHLLLGRCLAADAELFAEEPHGCRVQQKSKSCDTSSEKEDAIADLGKNGLLEFDDKCNGKTDSSAEATVRHHGPLAPGKPVQAHA